MLKAFVKTVLIGAKMKKEMELSDLVCDLEYAVKLKELGLHSKSVFSMCEIDMHISQYPVEHLKYINTYTTTELMEMLPSIIEIEEQELFLKINKKECGYSVDYNFEEKCLDEDFYAKFANALADCLIWHIENGYIKAEDL